MKWLGSFLLGLLLLVFALLAVAWFWTGTDTSLATALRHAQAYLPSDQFLVAEDVRGSLRQGGRIGELRWGKSGLTVHARQVDLRWQPKALLDRRLQLDTLQVAQLDVIDQRADTGAAPPPNDLLLPFHVDVNFVIDALRWAGSATPQATGVSGRYQFEGKAHSLKLDSAKLAAGTYKGEASLQARAPMTLDAKMQGEVVATIPGSEETLPLAATASARGDLAMPQPVFSVKAVVVPAVVGAPAQQNAAAATPMPAKPISTATPVQVQLDAQISPWAAQPIVKADASFTHLNLGLLWPDTPQTLLTGTARVVPFVGTAKTDTGSAVPKSAGGATAISIVAATAWQAQTTFTNALAGPWDRNRLPVDSAVADLIFDKGQWRVQLLTASVAGGRVNVQGNVNTTTAKGIPSSATSALSAYAGWQAQATLQNMNPAAVHTQLAPARVDGKVNATATSVPRSTNFDAELQPSANQPDASRLTGLQLKNAALKGRWANDILSLSTLKIETSDALLQGQLDVKPTGKSAQGQLLLTLPGGEARVQGKLGEIEGGGDFALRLSDASKASRWLRAQPGAAGLLAGYAVQGNGDITGTWTGGWRAALQSGQANNLTVQSSLRLPQLDLSGPNQTSAQAVRLRDVQADISGSLAALTLKAGGEWRSGSRRFILQTEASGGRSTAGVWQGLVGSAKLQTLGDSSPGTWTGQTRQPVSVSWTPTASGNVLGIGAGAAALIGPAPGAASIVWQPIRWFQSSARSELASKGQVQGVPMAWLDLLADAKLINLGLKGDLVFDGDWDVMAGDTLKAQASLVRRNGDISIQAERVTGPAVGTGTTVSAGVKDARIRLTANGDALQLSARWDSERAGLAQADFTTKTSSSGKESWSWPVDAPLAGTLRAQLPQVGVWSLLAPPGWRIRGTLDANIALTGTRGAPQWSGALNADSLALRSIADGIEFSNGRLRSTLSGQRLQIEEFSVQGAGGGAGSGIGSASPISVPGSPVGGGQLTAKGYAEWLSTGNTNVNVNAAAFSKVRIELAAQAQGLRVSARADRRLAVSGNMQATVLDAKVTIRGALKADQALFILPDENTPSLGDDVVVKPSNKNKAPAQATVVIQSPSSVTLGSTTASTTRTAPDVALTLDMGPDFRVQGRGLNTRLGGTLNLTSSTATSGVPRLAGTLTTVGGSYKAYGQQLNIEAGVMRFSGAYDNPALDILAIRPNLTARVGVQVTGTALSPRVRLYAEPELPDAEKLAWLVLGRSGANGGAESAVLQQAALALLGGNGKGLSDGLAGALGLDELSFRGSSSNADGSTSAAAVTLGKRLSRDFYVAYERSVAGTLGTVYIFYDLSKRFTLRAQTGEKSAIDLIFTVPFD